MQCTRLRNSTGKCFEHSEVLSCILSLLYQRIIYFTRGSPVTHHYIVPASAPSIDPRGAHYVTDFDRLFSKVKFFNHYTSTLLDFFIRQILWTGKLCPASLLSKIEQASQAELERRGAWSYLNHFYIFEILVKTCSK